jgi:hypothetical protein
MNDDDSEVKNLRTLAISRAVPRRCIGTRDFMYVSKPTASSCNFEDQTEFVVSTFPGDTRFIRIGAIALASEPIVLFNADLEATYSMGASAIPKLAMEPTAAMAPSMGSS